jgi:uncharacterized protein YqhQ
MADSRPYIGGQAVLEGVMMRAPGCLTVAVRRPDGTIAVRETPFTSRLARTPLLKLPLVRGVATLVESLSLGMGALRFSAEQQIPEEERGKADGETSYVAKWMTVVSIVFALVIFKGLPQALGWVAGRALHVDRVQDWRFHLIVGGFQLLVLLVYLLFVSRLPEMKRVFQYHGAEHKTIFAYEKGLPLTLENVRAQSTLHPRCGTTFLVVVIFVTIVAGAVVTPIVLPHATGWTAQLMTLGVRLALLPLIAAISFELQQITTREPDDAQLEIAIAAMESARWREKVGAGVPADAAPLVFPTFAAFLDAASSSLRGPAGLGAPASA